MKNKHSTMNNAWLIEDDYIDKYVSQLNNIPRLYLQYLPEESLNSWVIRNSILNQITPKAIIRHFFPQKRSCDLDFILEYHKWVNVLNVFNNKQEYENVEPAMAISLTSKRLKSYTIFSTYNNKLCFRFCPACLSTETPYYRTKWRFSFNIACEKHHCWLNSKCQKCNQEQNLTDTMNESAIPDDISRCIHCGNNLSSRSITPIQDNTSKQKIYVTQQNYMKVITNLEYVLFIESSCSGTISHSLTNEITPNIYRQLIDMETLRSRSYNERSYAYSTTWKNLPICYKTVFGETTSEYIIEHLNNH